MVAERLSESLLAGSSYTVIDSGGGSDDDCRNHEHPWATWMGLDQIENREVLRPLLEALPERGTNGLGAQVLRR